MTVLSESFEGFLRSKVDFSVNQFGIGSNYLNHWASIKRLMPINDLLIIN